jgi:hypothetical protein
MGRTKRHSANARQQAYLMNPTQPLTSADWSKIRFTQPMIHPTFSNRKELSVFDMYFAVRYEFMDVSNIPAIRVFKDDNGRLWSVDNRRLWVMKRARRGFNCENLYTREQDPKRFQEVQYKIRSLHGKQGQHAWFRSREPEDQVYICCINASKRGKLDDHIAKDHLNIDLEQITLLTRCPIHYKDRILCICLTRSGSGTLKDMIRRRCQILKQIMANAQLEASEEQMKLFEQFENKTTIPTAQLLFGTEQNETELPTIIF